MTFSIGSTHFKYLNEWYNGTRCNERTVEVPVALELMKGKRTILEVGAVLPHYAYHTHEVIDLYEEYPGVINADVLSYVPALPSYDLVLSISTIDHLLSPEDAQRAVERMKRWGKYIYITLPFGQVSWLDDAILGGCFGMHFVRLDKVDPVMHLWEETPMSAPLRPYNGETFYANSVFLLSYPRPLPF